jgi:hypothetical protein
VTSRPYPGYTSGGIEIAETVKLPRVPSGPAPGSARPEPPRTVRRLVLRDHEGRVVDVEDHGATTAELDSRARELMAWLRSPGPSGTQECGRHHQDHDPAATAVLPAYQEQQRG